MIKKSKIHYRECPKFRNYQIWSGTKIQNILDWYCLSELFSLTDHTGMWHSYSEYSLLPIFGSYILKSDCQISISCCPSDFSIQHSRVLTKQKMCLPQEVGLLICCLSPSLPSRDSVNFSCKFEYWSPIAQTASVFCWFDKQTQDSKPLFKTRWRCLTSTTNTTIINPADYYDT